MDVMYTLLNLEHFLYYSTFFFILKTKKAKAFYIDKSVRMYICMVSSMRLHCTKIVYITARISSVCIVIVAKRETQSATRPPRKY